MPHMVGGAGKSSADNDRIIATHRRASFDFELGKRFEAGLALQGSEVRALRTGNANLTDAYCSIERGELWVRGIDIPILSHAAFGHTAKRARKLLLHRAEIEEIARATERDGMTAVAVKLYFKGGRVKLELALARGKKKGDKRESIKEKDADREARAARGRSLKERG